MNLWADYIKERLGKLVFECDDGFAVYYYLLADDGSQSVYLEDIYVRPEARQRGVAAWIADQVGEEARARDCKVMLGSVNPKAHGATASLKVLLGYGMTLDSIADGLIYFTKSLED